jgi:hypothetical protein
VEGADVGVDVGTRVRVVVGEGAFFDSGFAATFVGINVGVEVTVTRIVSLTTTGVEVVVGLYTTVGVMEGVVGGVETLVGAVAVETV